MALHLLASDRLTHSIKAVQHSKIGHSISGIASASNHVQHVFAIDAVPIAVCDERLIRRA